MSESRENVGYRRLVAEAKLYKNGTFDDIFLYRLATDKREGTSWHAQCARSAHFGVIKYPGITACPTGKETFTKEHARTFVVSLSGSNVRQEGRAIVTPQ